MFCLRLFPLSERASIQLYVFGKTRWWRATIEQSTYFSSLLLLLPLLRLLSLLCLCFVLSLLLLQQQPLSAIHRMVCRRSRWASTKLFEKISLVALCICPFDDDTYHLSLARIFSINVCGTKRSAKTKSIPCLFRCSPLRLACVLHHFGRCGTTTAQYVPWLLSVRREHHGRTNKEKKYCIS